MAIEQNPADQAVCSRPVGWRWRYLTLCSLARPVVLVRTSTDLPRVAPPRERIAVPLSLRIRCTKPYERPVDSDSSRMLAPPCYCFTIWLASLSRFAPVIRAPFLMSAMTAS
jgi:hypothetical protein